MQFVRYIKVSIALRYDSSTKEVILAKLPHIKLSIILQRNGQLVSREEIGNSLIGWYFHEKQRCDDKSRISVRFWIVVPNSNWLYFASS